MIDTLGKQTRRQPRASTPLLKLHLDRFDGINAFTGYGNGFVMVNGQRHERSLIVLPERLIDPWLVRLPSELTEDSLDDLITLPLEIVLLGTGATMSIVHPRLYRKLSAARIGVEVMDSQAACRTYNILVAEGRKVAAALMLGV